MANDTLQFTVELRDQLTQALDKVNKALDATAAAAEDVAKASDEKKFGFDKTAKHAGTLSKALEQGKRVASGFSSRWENAGGVIGRARDGIRRFNDESRLNHQLAQMSGQKLTRMGASMQTVEDRFGRMGRAANKVYTGMKPGLDKVTSGVRSTFDKIDSVARPGLSKAKNSVSKFAEDVRKKGKESGTGFANGFKNAVGALGIGVAVAGAGSFAASAVQEAGNAEQALGAIDAVFKGGAKSVRDFAKTADESVGLSINQFGELATVLGAQLKNGGVSMDQLGKKTTDLVTMGADMSAMFGGTAADAVGAISAALRGERDPIEQYGVSLNQAAVDAKAAELGFKKVGGSLSTEASQAATIALIMEQTADAHGRFAAESGTVMNEQQKLTAGWANMKTEIGDRLIPYVSDLFGWLNQHMPGALDTVLGALDGTISGLKNISEWVRGNVVWLGILAGTFTAVGIATWVANGGLVAMAAGVRGVFLAISTGIKSIPVIGWIIAGIGLLTAALVWFFTKTETGQKIWEATWNGIKGAVSGVVDWFSNTLVPIFKNVFSILFGGDFQGGGNLEEDSPIVNALFSIREAGLAVVNWFQNTAIPMFQNIWNGIVAGAQWMWNNVLKPIWDGIQIGFLVVATLIGAYWEFVLKPVFNGIAATALWLWNNALKPAWDGIKWGWNMLVTGIKLYWEMVLKPAFAAVAAFGLWLWNNALKPAFDWIKQGWNNLVLGVKILWETVLKPAWDAVVAGARWLWHNGVKPIVDAFKLGWQTLGDGIRWVKDNVISPVFTAVKSAGDTMWAGLRVIFDHVKNGIDAVGDGFKLAKDVIKTAWDGIKSAAKGPAEFVVNTVYNDGIRKIWNKAAGIFNMDDKKLPEIKMATGGRVRGPGTGTSDDVPARLSNGEFVVNADATRKHLPLLHAINGPQGVGYSSAASLPMKDGAIALAKGGTLIDAANWWVAKGARGSRHPAFGGAVRSGHSKNSLHYQDKAVDLNYGPGGTNATEMAFFDKWVKEFKSAFPGIRVIWRAKGHYNHMHIDTANGADIGDFSGAKSGAGGGSIFDVSPLTELINKVKGYKNQAGHFGQGLLNAGKNLVQGALDKINPLNVMDNVTSGVKDVVTKGTGKARGLAWAVAQGWPPGGKRWKALDYIVSHESGWDPTAQNPNSTASGLGQFINATSRHYLGGAPMSKFPFDDQLKAIVRYTDDRYGGLQGAMDFWKRKHYYRDGGIVNAGMPPVGVYDNGGPWEPGTMGVNTSGEREMVLTGQQSQIVTTGLKQMTETASGGRSLTIEEVNINFHGDVIGVEDLDAYLRDAVEELMEEIEREWEERR